MTEQYEKKAASIKGFVLLFSKSPWPPDQH